MYRAKIKLVYKQEIDYKSASAFEKAIFNASYEEFRLKSQAYNHSGRLKTFSAMKAYDGRANSLHYKLSFSVLHFIAQLDNKIPLLKDNLGNRVRFETPRFELIDSHVDDISIHRFAIHYETAAFTLVEFMGEYLLLAEEAGPGSDEMKTFVLRMQPGLSIASYEEPWYPAFSRKTRLDRVEMNGYDLIPG